MGRRAGNGVAPSPTDEPQFGAQGGGCSHLEARKGTAPRGIAGSGTQAEWERREARPVLPSGAHFTENLGGEVRGLVCPPSAGVPPPPPRRIPPTPLALAAPTTPRFPGLIPLPEPRRSLTGVAGVLGAAVRPPPPDPRGQSGEGALGLHCSCGEVAPSTGRFI